MATQLVKPSKIYSRTIGNWLYWNFVRPPFLYPEEKQSAIQEASAKDQLVTAGISSSPLNQALSSTATLAPGESLPLDTQTPSTAPIAQGTASNLASVSPQGSKAKNAAAPGVRKMRMPSRLRNTAAPASTSTLNDSHEQVQAPAPNSNLLSSSTATPPAEALGQTEERGEQLDRLVAASEGLATEAANQPLVDSATQKSRTQRKTRPTFKEAFKNLVLRAFLVTFPIESYNFKTGQWTYSNSTNYRAGNRVIEDQGRTFSRWILFFAFIGLPTRLAHGNPEATPTYSWGQFGRDLIGGFEWDESTSTEKKVFQVIGLVTGIKSVVIPVGKVAAMIAKIPLHIVKFFSEFAMIVVQGTAALTAYKLRERAAMGVSKKVASIRMGRPKAYGLVLLSAIPQLIHIPFRILSTLGRNVTSPANSAEMAFAIGSELKISIFGDTVGTGLSYVFGAIGWLMSIAVSTAFWGVLMPLTIGAIITYVPVALVPLIWVSKLPLVASAIVWVSHLPMIASSLVVMNSALVSAGSVLGLAFAPIVAYLTGLLGLSAASTLLVTCTTLGALFPLISSVVSSSAQYTSDVYHRWHEQGPFTRIGHAFASVIFPSENKDGASLVTGPRVSLRMGLQGRKANTEGYDPLVEEVDLDNVGSGKGGPAVRKPAQQLGQAQADSEGELNRRANALETTGGRADAPDATGHAANPFAADDDEEVQFFPDAQATKL